MTGVQAVEKLKQWGYQITLKRNGRISAALPGGLNAPLEAGALLKDIRRDRESVVAFLKDLEVGYQVVESDVQLFRSGNLCDFLALLWDAFSYKIKFVGDIVYHTETGMLEAYWQPIEPLPFYRPGLSGKDMGDYIFERVNELHQEKESKLPLVLTPWKLIEGTLLDCILRTCK
jgi:hypothetical protein